MFLLGCKPEHNKSVIHNKDDNDLSAKLDEYFLTLTTLEKFNGVVLIEQEGKQLLFKEFNMSENAASSLNVIKQSQFDIHSISKLMAKAVIVDLEKENLLSRSDKISKFISEFPNGDKITILHLIDNQSGLPRGFTKEISNLIEKNPNEVVDFIAQEELLFDPGSDSMYSNLGYQLLYFIISKVVKKPFVQYLNDAYFQPLNMNNTGAHFHLQNNNLNNLVKNHENDDGEIVMVANIQSDGKNQAKIYSTVEDLMAFIKLVKEETYLDKLKNKNNRVGWSGGGDGILSHAEYNIYGDYEFVFFSNYDEIPFGDILKTVDKIMNSEPYELPQKINRKAIEIAEKILKRYEGKYRVKEFNNNIFEFRVESGKLVMYQDGERGGILNAETDSTFFDVPDAEDYFEFRKLDEGNYRLIFHYKKVEIEGTIEHSM
jgi:hypothetical protein